MSKEGQGFRSRAWDLIFVAAIVVIGAVVVVGLASLQRRGGSTRTAMLALVVGLGLLTLLLFAGPGLLYTLRKRIPRVRKLLPGKPQSWLRAHIYIAALAVFAGYAHASATPFKSALSSGKVVLAFGVVTLLAGILRRRLLGIQAGSIRSNAAISRLMSGRSRGLVALVDDLRDARRPRAEIDVDVAALDPTDRATFDEIAALTDESAPYFPPGGGQRRQVLTYKVFNVIHPWLAVVFFGLVIIHVLDVFDSTRAVRSDPNRGLVAASTCGGCHTTIFDEWSQSAMAHTQTSSVFVAQLAVTLAKNRDLVGQALFDAAAPSCLNCHTPGAADTGFLDGLPGALLPFREAGSRAAGKAVTRSGDAAVHSDGVGCLACHAQSAAPGENDAPTGAVKVGKRAGLYGYGTVFGPLFERPLPVAVHDTSDANGFWSDPVSASGVCGSCHNVKLDLDGNGVAPPNTAEALTDPAGRRDSNGDLKLDQNDADGQNDLILQTTYDEWQNYVVARQDDKDARPGLSRPLGCGECHMPLVGNGTRPVVQYAPGLLKRPVRAARSHTFIGVEYELTAPTREKIRAIAERKALLGSTVTLDVTQQKRVGNLLPVDVRVANNLLGHDFPTGFAFARQFWLDVSARTASGQAVCLASVFSSAPRVGQCASGSGVTATADLPQCDPSTLRDELRRRRSSLPGAVTIGGNLDIKFAATAPLDTCDPWLVNFQKVLTDGQKNAVGQFTEVPYQSFRPDIVKIRRRVAFDQAMNTLPGVEAVAGKSAATFRYLFDVSGLALNEDVVVTVTMRFRHLPPDMLKALEREQKSLAVIPASARIDSARLLSQLVIDDVVTARSGEGPALACPGPQNEEGRSIFTCIGKSAPAP